MDKKMFFNCLGWKFSFAKVLNWLLILAVPFILNFYFGDFLGFLFYGFVKLIYIK